MSISITITPNSGKIGDIVKISTSDSFTYPNFNKNVITFKSVNTDIIAKIIKADDNQNISVTVPVDAITGTVMVERTDGEIGTASFQVIYDNKVFDNNDSPYNKAYINNKIKTFGSPGYSMALYNKDISYSNFVSVTDENSLLQNVYTILLTQKGERMFSDFGVGLDAKLFTLIDDELLYKDELMKEIVTAVSDYEPRVTILEGDSYIVVNGENINIILSIMMPQGNVEKLGITLKSINNVEN